jgi:Cu/Zn superoxide dismutase
VKTISILVSVSMAAAAAACGGGAQQTRPESTPEPRVEAPRPAPEPEPEPEPVPPPPQTWTATAALTPVKGSKMKPQTVTFRQTEGESASATSGELAGLKPGTYHLVIHEASACGPNATKAGPPWPGAAGAELRVQVTKAEPGALAADELALSLEGEESIVGRTLVLHEDKKGKPGKALACGEIAMAADAPDEDEDFE